MQRYTVYFIWNPLYMFRVVPPPIIRSAPDDGWRYHPKHVERIPDKINCVTLHLVRYTLEDKT